MSGLIQEGGNLNRPLLLAADPCSQPEVGFVVRLCTQVKIFRRYTDDVVGDCSFGQRSAPSVATRLCHAGRRSATDASVSRGGMLPEP